MIYKDLCFSPSILPVLTNLGPCWGPLAFHLSVDNVLLCMYCSTTSLVTCQGQIWDSHPSKYVMPKDKDRHHRTVSLRPLPLCCTDENHDFPKCKLFRIWKKSLFMLIATYIFTLPKQKYIFTVSKLNMMTWPSLLYSLFTPHLLKRIVICRELTESRVLQSTTTTCMLTPVAT